MNKNYSGKYRNRIIIIIVLATCAFSLYKLGYKIPVLKEIPFFSSGHEHMYKPVISEDGEIEYWTCTMHPSVKLKEPGKCPICSMDLVSVRKRDKNSKGVGGTSGEITGMQNMNMDKSPSANMHSMHDMGGMQGTGNMSGMEVNDDGTARTTHSTFSVSPERQQTIGVRTVIAKTRPMIKEIRTVGTVELDETKIKQVQTKFSGWIDKVYADYTFKHVNRGDPLFSVYSPDLVSTQQEYLLALKSKKILSGSEFPEISGGSVSLAEATKRRLMLWDISESQIKQLESTGNIQKNLIIYSPVSGHITYKNAFENMYVEPDTLIYTIADHSSVWVNADIYEDEIQLVKLGQEASITVDSVPGKQFRGKAKFIWPHLSAKTRTTKVRFEFDNPDLQLLPEMYADVFIEIPLGNKLTIPVDSVLRTGTKDVVIVDKGQGIMELRRVELGQKSDQYYEVLRGLREGESVVARANFLIDSESKVQAAVATWQDDTSVISGPELPRLKDSSYSEPDNNIKDQSDAQSMHQGH